MGAKAASVGGGLTHTLDVWGMKGAHAGVAVLSGLRVAELRPLAGRTVVPAARDGEAEARVRHAGWLASCALAVAAGLLARGLDLGGRPAVKGALLGLWVTALEAVWSDLLQRKGRGEGVFRCGNFGLLLLEAMPTGTVLDTLQKMVEVTMMRGAQSGGVVTFHEGGKGQRSRVVNGKRTDLSKLIRDAVAAKERRAPSRSGETPAGRFFAGHTRFATTSKVTFEGTHPQQWSPPRVFPVWCCEGGRWRSERREVSNFVNHNGDLDFFRVSRTLELGDYMDFLESVLGRRPADVDSVAIAGSLDLLRCQGVWFLAVRYALLFGVDPAAAPKFKGAESLEQEVGKAADGLEKLFAEIVAEGSSPDPAALRGALKRRALEHAAEQKAPWFVLDADVEKGNHLVDFVEAAVDAFFDNDLLHAMKSFLERATGSFGLCFSSSLDAHRQLVLGSRGQTMCIAFYPHLGAVLFGSEQAAVKAALALYEQEGRSPEEKARLGPRRLDLDDLGGELALLDWGAGPPTALGPAACAYLQQFPVMNGAATLTLLQEDLVAPPFKTRLVHLDDEELVHPLPPTHADPVAVVSCLAGAGAAPSRQVLTTHRRGLNRTSRRSPKPCSGSMTPLRPRGESSGDEEED